MKFLTILIVLLLNHYWRRDRHLAVDSWFVAWQRWLLNHRHRLPEWRALIPAMAVILPLLPLLLLIWLAQGVFFGLLTLGIHVLVVLYCFSRHNQDLLVEQYLELWEAGDYEAACQMVEPLVQETGEPAADDYARIHSQFMTYLQRTALRKLFAVLFFYFLLGPAGALAYCLLVAMFRDGRLLDDVDDFALFERTLAAVEWVPVRVLAFSFALAGDFVGAFRALRNHFWQAPDLLANFSLLAAATDGAAGLDDVEATAQESRLRAAHQLKALQDLLLRTQVVWVIVLSMLVFVV
ncbi:MAG: regulatory signaling modulator protein AmpE [Pseudomonadota bacterium]|nr:regulatory signaling modulator protein AmpE [Pseudomonadota bacterium]